MKKKYNEFKKFIDNLRQKVDGDSGDTKETLEWTDGMKNKAIVIYKYLYMETVWVMKCNAKAFARNGKSSTGKEATTGNQEKSLSSSNSHTADDKADIEEGAKKHQRISFHGMLMIVARYKLVDNEDAFSTEEQLRHRQRMYWLHSVRQGKAAGDNGEPPGGNSKPPGDNGEPTGDNGDPQKSDLVEKKVDLVRIPLTQERIDDLSNPENPNNTIEVLWRKSCS
jgi:hypothetical protein